MSYIAIHLTSCNVTWTQSLLSSYVTRWISNSTQSHRQLVNVQISSCSVLQRDKRSTQVKRPLEQLNLRHKTLVSICIFARYWSLLVIKVFSTSCTKQCRKSIFGPRCVSKISNQGQVQVAWLGRVVIGRSELAKMWTCMYVCKGGCQKTQKTFFWIGK